jgi:hypothetical protein
MPSAAPATYVTNLTHFEGALDPASAAPAAARKLALFFDDLVRIASRESLGAIRTDVRCFKRPGRRPCPGKIVTTRARGQDEIGWECPSCGTGGVIHHWQGAEADLSRYARPEAAARQLAGPGTKFEGTWRITEMELWDSEAIDLLGPGNFRFDADQSGEFQLIAVRGWLDCRYGERDGEPLVEFSWEGDDEGTDRCGRGWAVVAGDGTLSGRFFFHRGDDSSFTAERTERRAPK